VEGRIQACLHEGEQPRARDRHLAATWNDSPWGRAVILETLFAMSSDVKEAWQRLFCASNQSWLRGGAHAMSFGRLDPAEPRSGPRRGNVELLCISKQHPRPSCRREQTHTNRNLGHLLCLSYFLFFDTQWPSLQSHSQPLVKKSIFFDSVCRLRLA
jgi:hypothetical protein